MKLSKVRNSNAISKILFILTISILTIFNANSQTYPNSQNTYPGGVLFPGYPGAFPNVGNQVPQQAPNANPNGQPVQGAQNRTTVVTPEEAVEMTHQDSLRMAAEERENEDLALDAKRRKIYGYKLFNGQAYDPNVVMNIPSPNNYVLGAGDKLSVDVYGYIQEHQDVTVNADGYVTISKVGVVQASGKTIDEVESSIKAAYLNLYRGFTGSSLKVKVSLPEVRSIKITITGEVIAPGTYTMSSLNTVMNALYKSGGPNEVGSYREIRVVRNNKVIANLDLYDILQNGFSDQNVLLHDQDVIQVPTFKERVIISGETKRTGYFELKEEETLRDAIVYAGDFSPEAYSNRIKVYRNNSRQKEIIDVSQDQFQNFHLKTGDSLAVGKVLERYTNMVKIEGAVYRPGEYSLDNNSTLSQLIESGEGLRDEALVGRISLIRLNDDLSIRNISINYADIINGKSPDVPLRREDLVVVHSRFDLTEESYIRISGAINNENAAEGVEIPYINNMTLEDLLVRVGGLTEAASLNRIEIVRRKKNVNVNMANAQISEIIQLEVSPDLSVGGDKGVVLEPFDEIFVRKSPNYEEQTFVTLQGEVFYPSTYGIQSKEERISDLIKRAGGLTLQAYIPGATLIRTVELTDREIEQRKKTLRSINKTEPGETVGLLDEEELSNFREESIGIDLAKIMQNPGSLEDITLRDGDIIKIPKKLETVRVQGEVLYPTTVKYLKGSGLKNYIAGSGGFTNKSLKRKTYVLYPNGSVDKTRKLLVFNLYPKIQPGSEIIVPQKTQNGAEQLQSISTILGTLSATLGTIFGIYGILKLNN